MKQVDLICPINFSGYGVHATNLALALARANYNFRIFPIGDVQGYPEDIELLKPYFAKNDLSNKNITVELWHETAIKESSTRKGMGTWIYYPVFEFCNFKPEFQPNFKLPEGFLTVSAYNQEAIVNLVSPKTKVNIVNEGVSKHFAYRSKKDTTFSMPTLINVGKHESRKNTYAIVAGLAKSKMNINLIMLPNNNFISNDKYLDTLKANGFKKLNDIHIKTSFGFIPMQWYRNDHSNIYFTFDHIDRNQYVALINTADLGIFASVAEGWNLPLMECLSVGLPCITTSNTGMKEYLDAINQKVLYIIPSYNTSPFKDVICHEELPFYSHITINTVLADYKDSITRAFTDLKTTMSPLLSSKIFLENVNTVYSWDNSAKQFIEAMSQYE